MFFMPAVFRNKVESQLLADYFSSCVSGYYVDVGGNLPKNSISQQFVDMGWDGLIIEPIPENVDKFKSAGRNNIWQGAVTSPEEAIKGEAIFHLAGGNGAHSSLDGDAISPTSLSNKTIQVALSTLDTLLSRAGVESVDFLSIDTEGTEVHVLHGVDLDKFNVKLVLVEDWGRDFNIHRHMVSRGYKRVRRTGFNSWYVQNSDNSITVSLYGQLQLFRKFVLSMPFKKLRLWRHKRKYL
jgi:FkbM family methyltransferase